MNVNCFQNTHKSSVFQRADITATLITQVLTAVATKSSIMWGLHGVIQGDIILRRS
jgi:hypothetical protein